MPKFFFNLREGGVLIVDPEGSDLPDIEAARDVARQTAREMLISRLQDNKEVDGGVLEITDHEGTIVDSIALADVLKNSGALIERRVAANSVRATSSAEHRRIE